MWVSMWAMWAMWATMLAMWAIWATMSAIHVESRVGEHVGHVGNVDNHVGIRVGRALLFSMVGPIPAVISACHQKENTEATSLWLLRYTYYVRPRRCWYLENGH